MFHYFILFLKWLPDKWLVDDGVTGIRISFFHIIPHQQHLQRLLMNVDKVDKRQQDRILHWCNVSGQHPFSTYDA